MDVFVRINDRSGPRILATRQCRVVVSNAEDCSEFAVDATVVSAADIAKTRLDSLAADTQDPNYTAEWVYESELDGNAMRQLFRKRGSHTHAIEEEDSCGDDTADYFRLHVGIGDEEIVTTQNGWRIFRNAADLEKWQESGEPDSAVR